MTCILAVVFLLAQTGHEWLKASSAFASALGSGSEEKLEAAVLAVAKDNSERAVELLVTGLARPNPRFYWIILIGLSKCGSKEAVAALEKEILSRREILARQAGGVRRDLMMSLALNGSPFADDALLKILKEGTPDIRILAIDELVKRGKKEAVPALIAVVKEEESVDGELKRQALKGLRALTDVDKGQTAAAWQEWWEVAKDAFRVAGDSRPRPAQPGTTVAERLGRRRTTEYEELRRGGKGDIIVVSGVYDGVEHVLNTLAIAHTVISKADFDKQDLSATHSLLVNCDDYKRTPFTKRQQERIRAYVASGRYLFTSDWGLVDVLKGAFPGVLRFAGVTGQERVDIFPRKGSTGHPLLREVFMKMRREGGKEGKSANQLEEKLEFKWVIDAQSYLIDPDPGKAVVLVESPDLASKYKFGAVAVTFPFGDGMRDPNSVATGGVCDDLAKLKGGKVLHVVSHFSHQGTMDGNYSIQKMLLNFLIEAKERTKLRGARK